MNLNYLKRLLVVLALVGAASWQSQAQNNVSTLWIKVSDDFAVSDTNLLWFCNTALGTYNLDSLSPNYYEVEPPPAPPAGPDFKWTGFRPPAAGTYGGYPIDIHGIPGNASVKDTFQLTVNYVGTDADFSNFKLEWGCPTSILDRCDSMFLVAKTAGLTDLGGNPIPAKIDMTTQSSLDLGQPIQAIGSSSFRFHIYRYGVKLIDDLSVPPNTGCVTDVSELSNRVPSTFALHQNYPNPFNPTTTITFDVQKRSFVTIGVFNLLGQQVSSLVAGEVNPGTFSTVWNGMTGRGISAGSGVYIVRMAAQTLDGKSEVFSSLRKIVLMK